jgi:hypothetical protein
MHAFAEDNIRRYRGPRRCRDVRSVLADVRTFPMPDGPLLFYMYHPFQRPVMQAMLARVREEVERKPQPVYFIYLFPFLGSMLEEAGYERMALRRSKLMDHLDVGIYRAAFAAA